MSAPTDSDQKARTATMRERSPGVRHCMRLVSGVAAAAGLTACAQDAPQDTWQPAGDNAQTIQDRLGIPQPLRATFIGYDEMPGNYQDVRHRIPDTTKAQELLGFEAKVSLDDGLTRTIEWHREQRLRAAIASTGA